MRRGPGCKPAWKCNSLRVLQVNGSATYDSPTRFQRLSAKATQFVTVASRPVWKMGRKNAMSGFGQEIARNGFSRVSGELNTSQISSVSLEKTISSAGLVSTESHPRNNRIIIKMIPIRAVGSICQQNSARHTRSGRTFWSCFQVQHCFQQDHRTAVSCRN